MEATGNSIAQLGSEKNLPHPPVQPTVVDAEPAFLPVQTNAAEPPPSADAAPPTVDE